VVSLEELRATVSRMEQRLSALEPQVKALMTAAPRFRADLEDELHQLLCKAGALMLVQQVGKERG